LGDNIFTHDFKPAIKKFKKGAKVFVKEVPDPERFGIIEFDCMGRVKSIEEKPVKPKSHFAQVGFYIFDKYVSKYASEIKPSKRGELEIVDLAKVYLKKNQLQAEALQGDWIDAGTFESLYKASTIVRENDMGIEFDHIKNIHVEIKEVKRKITN